MKKGFLLIGTAITAGLAMMSLSSCGDVKVEALRDYTKNVDEKAFASIFTAKSASFMANALALGTKIENTSGFTFTESYSETNETTMEAEDVKVKQNRVRTSSKNVEYSDGNNVLYVEESSSESVKSDTNNSSKKNNEKIIKTVDVLYSYDVDLVSKSYTKEINIDFARAKEKLKKSAVKNIDDIDIDFDFDFGYYADNVVYYVDDNVFTVKTTNLSTNNTSETIMQFVLVSDTELVYISNVTTTSISSYRKYETKKEISSKVKLTDDGFVEEDASTETTTEDYFASGKEIYVTKFSAKAEFKNVDPGTKVDLDKYTEIK